MQGRRAPDVDLFWPIVQFIHLEDTPWSPHQEQHQPDYKVHQVKLWPRIGVGAFFVHGPLFPVLRREDVEVGERESDDGRNEDENAGGDEISLL